MRKNLHTNNTMQSVTSKLGGAAPQNSKLTPRGHERKQVSRPQVFHVPPWGAKSSREIAVGGASVFALVHLDSVSARGGGRLRARRLRGARRPQRVAHLLLCAVPREFQSQAQVQDVPRLRHVSEYPHLPTKLQPGEPLTIPRPAVQYADLPTILRLQ